jgi:predicted aspartyl protease
MDPRYKRSSSSGRYANPARSSTGTFVDPYDYTSYHPSSPRSSIGGSPYDYNTERNKTPKDSLIFHTESSPIPEPPRDQQPDDMVWDGGNLSTSPTSVKTPNGRLAPPTLQVNTRQRNISEAETITPFNFLPSSGLRPRGSLPKEPLGDSTTHIPIRYHDDTEEDLEVDNNKFTFSPTELRQLLSSKSTRPFYAVERLKRIELGLRQDRPKADVMNDERMYIPGFLAHLPQFTVKALPDTGAKYNFMKESQAKELGVPIQRDIIRSVIVTKAKTIRTVGVVVAPFTFQGETESHLLKFHLLKDCVHDIILGKAFLKATKTFSNMVLKAKRVVTNFTQRLATLRLNYLGDSAPRFTGLLNGRIRQALGDTGAQGLFMDEKFARANGFSIVDDPDSILNVQYADGSTATTIGMVHGIKWEYGLGGRSVEYMLDFHVLKDAPADIILSDDFLHDTEAFAEYDCYLIDVDDEDDEDDEEDEGHLFAIKLFKKQVQSGMYYLSSKATYNK